MILLRGVSRLGFLVLCVSCLCLIGLGSAPVRATVSRYMAPEQLARRAVLVVEGRVARTASGFDEATGRLSTYVTLEVTAVHRGPSDLHSVVVRQPGGAHGSLVHDVDAVARWAPGEEVLVFLEPARDGALITVGMFFGKFSLRPSRPGGGPEAVRQLDGQGRILGRPAHADERFALGDLVAVASASGPAAARRPAARKARGAPRGERRWLSVPSEYDRLSWDDVRQPPVTAVGVAEGGRSGFAPRAGAPPAASPAFVPMEPGNPTRWAQVDSDVPVTVHVEPGGNPLGDDAATVAEVERAMASWNDVPQARIRLQTGDVDFDYTSTHALSPAVGYSGTNVILFDDPYDDIADPEDCSGVLAIGGYWRTHWVASTVNGIAFHPALQLYVIVNNDFECFIDDPETVAEVVAHELGHGIGFGHSPVSDALMRGSAYGDGRGPRLGDDDLDAVHCHYPHTLTLQHPNGGEVLEGGSPTAIAWASSGIAEADPGLVSLELSDDGGATWDPIAADVPDDGLHDWIVPDLAGANLRVRVVRHPARPLVSPYPAACSADASNGPFTIVPAPVRAGAVPDGRQGPPLRLRRHGVQLHLSWGASCSATADGHAVYEGSLGALRAGLWDHAPLTCQGGTDLSEYVNPGPGDRYYLIAPLAGDVEGEIGTSSAGAWRPASALACAARQADPGCPGP